MRQFFKERLDQSLHRNAVGLGDCRVFNNFAYAKWKNVIFSSNVNNISWNKHVMSFLIDFLSLIRIFCRLDEVGDGLAVSDPTNEEATFIEAYFCN